MIKLLLDQGLPRGGVDILARLGWDVVHTGDIGLSQATDRQLLEYANENDRIIVTLDADLHAMIAVDNAAAPSVIRIRIEGLKASDLSSLLVKHWRLMEPHLKIGAMVTIDKQAVRIRSIPLAP